MTSAASRLDGDQDLLLSGSLLCNRHPSTHTNEAVGGQNERLKVQRQRHVKVHDQSMDEFEVEVEGVPPAKNEAKSMLAEAHKHSKRVIALLNAARDATRGLGLPVFDDGHLILELTVFSPAAPIGDATNYLGGVGDVLQVKGAHGSVAHLGELAQVAVYSDDKQFQEIHYRWLKDSTTRYRVRIRRRQAGM